MKEPAAASPSRRLPASQRAARALLALSVFGSVMALGALHTTVLVVVALVTAAAALCAWWGAEPMRARPAATIVFWVGVGLTFWTALQCVPIPASWLRAIAPANADVWARCLAPLREAGPSWVTVSLDPVATRVEVLRGMTYLLAFLTAIKIAARKDGVLFLEITIGVTGLALAVAAWLHPALGAERVFGVYKPMEPIPLRHVAPLLNPNMLAGYLNIALCVALAQAVSVRPSIPRVITIAVVALLFSAQLWIASRGAFLAMGAGAALAIWMARLARSDARQKVALLLPLALVAAGIAMTVLASSEQARQELSEADITKLQLAKRALHAGLSFPLFGMGRGAFESVFAAFRVGAGHVVYTHPENLVAQWTTEWGLPVAVTAFVALLVALRPTSALARTTAAAGVWAAIVCLALQNLVDFSSELPAAVIALATCAAVVVGGTAGTAPRSRFEGWAKRPRALLLAAGLATITVAVVVALAEGGELVHDRQTLRDAALTGTESQEEFHAQVRQAMLRHPAEAYLPFSAALRASRLRDESVVPWIERTLERAPVYGPAHYLLARELAVERPVQARLEYRLAMTQDPQIEGPAVRAGVRLVGGFYDAMDLVPEGRDGAHVLESVVQAIKARLPATRARLDEQIALRDADAPGPLIRALDDTRDDLRAGDAAPWCVRDTAACLARGLRLADRLEQATPLKCAPHARRAALLAEQGEKARALAGLSAAVDRVTDSGTCLRALADLAVSVGDEAEATFALDRLARIGCTSDSECVENLLFAAAAEDARGSPSRALTFLTKAHQRAPEDESLLKSVAQRASSLGLHAQALHDYRQLADAHPDDAAFRDSVAREQRALLDERGPR